MLSLAYIYDIICNIDFGTVEQKQEKSRQVNGLRIEEHPVLDFERGEKVTFYFNDQVVEAYSSETIAAALHAAGVRKLGESSEMHRPRGLFCAIGNCSSCFMIVDDQPNMRVCVMKVKQGMRVEEQKGKGVLKP